jgi:membrane associated rhomboid family serine protease
MARLLTIVLVVDAALSLGFGLVSYLSPESTYATIVDLSGVHEHSAMSSTLGSLSIFYVVIGALCGLAAFMPSPHDLRVAAVMILQHAWIGLKGLSDMDRPWIVGDPLPDLIIHSLFVIAYAIGIAWRSRLPNIGTVGR